MSRILDYNGRPAYPRTDLPCWYSVSVSRLADENGDDVALNFALFDCDDDGEVRAEVHGRRKGGDVAQLWQRGKPDSLLWSKEYRSPATPGWYPYRDVLTEVVKATGRPLPDPLREYVERVESQARAILDPAEALAREAGLL